MTTSSRDAWEDLRTELVDLRNLVDSKAKDAKLIYQFDKRKTLKTEGGEGDGNDDGSGGGDKNTADKENDDDNQMDN